MTDKTTIVSWQTPADHLQRSREMLSEIERRLAGFTQPPISVLCDAARLHLEIAKESDRQEELNRRARMDEILVANVRRLREDRKD